MGPPMALRSVACKEIADLLTLDLMADLDPMVLLLVGGAVAVAIVTVFSGKRFVARWGKNSVDAGGGAGAKRIKAGRNALVRVTGPGATAEDVEAGQDADVRVEEKP